MNEAVNGTRRLSILVFASGTGEGLSETVKACRMLGPAEIIVLANGLAEKAAAAVSSSGCKVHVLDPALSRNRPIVVPGGFRIFANAVLYLDAEMKLEPALLRKLVEPVLYGAAQAVFLSEDRPRQTDIYPNPERAWAVWWNRTLGRPDLRESSLYAFPFVLSGQAADLIAGDFAANPAMGMAKLIKSGLRLERRTVLMQEERGRSFRPEWFGGLPSETTRYDRLVADDHLSALEKLSLSPRGGHTDGKRRRDIVRQVLERKKLAVVQEGAKLPVSGLYGGKSLSVIIPACNEAGTIAHVVRQVRRLEPAEIIVVDNGSSDRTAPLAFENGAKTVRLAEGLGTDCGRAIGAFHAKGDILLFVDADFVMSAAELYPFALAISRGYDVALNDRNYLLEMGIDDPVISSIYALNNALGQKALGASSMTTVPFAISRRVLQRVGPECLQCPPRALSACLSHGFKPVLAGRVYLEKRNRVRPDKHIAVSGLSPAASQIVGDHIEAMLNLNEYNK